MRIQYDIAASTMLTLLLQVSVCNLVEIDGCTPCTQIFGAQQYFSEDRTYCVCATSTHMIQFAGGKLICQYVQPGKIVNSAFDLVDSPCVANGTYYDQIGQQCLVCDAPYQSITDNQLCINSQGVKVTGGKPSCELGYAPQYQGVDKTFAGCLLCQDGKYTLLDSSTGDYVCGVCDAGTIKIGQVCQNVTSSMCTQQIAGTVVGYQSCRCADGSLPIYSVAAGGATCTDKCNDQLITVTAFRTPSQICHADQRTLMNTTCPPEYPLNVTTGLCDCPVGFATAFINFAQQAQCVNVILASFDVQACNPGALYYQIDGKAERLVCAQTGQIDALQRSYLLCTSISAKQCTKCADIAGTESYNTELTIQCHCKDISQQITVVDGKLACAAVQTGFYVTPQFNLIKHNCQTMDAFMDVNAQRCMKCDLAFQKATANGLCIEEKGAYWVGNYSRCQLGFGSKHGADKQLLGCEECPAGTYSIVKDNAQVCGTCKKNEFRVSSICVPFTDAICQQIVDETVAGYKRCVCPDHSLPYQYLKSDIIMCGQQCTGNKTVYTASGIPTIVCHSQDRTLFNTTCATAVNHTTGLCVCPEGQATFVPLLANGTHSDQAICVDVMLKASHVESCNKDALFYYDSVKTANLRCAQTGNSNIYKRVYGVCTAVSNGICTQCSDVAGARQVFGENTVRCACTNVSEQIQVINEELACGPVEKGFYYDQRTFNSLETNCSAAQFFNPATQKCSSCAEAYETQTPTGLCIWKDGIYVVNGTARCAQGYKNIGTAATLACEHCPAGEHSIIGNNSTTCGVCKTFEHYYAEKCYYYDNATCGAHGLQARFSKCVCANSELPLHEIATDSLKCGQCGDGNVATKYLASAVPSFVCHQPMMTIMNTTCPDAYPLDKETGLCSCPTGWATVFRYLADGTALKQSTCAQILIDTFHTRNCNEHALFVYGRGGIEMVLCAQHGNMAIYDRYYEVCSVVDTRICLRCAEIPGAHPVYTEMQQFCYCDNSSEMIQIVNGELKCAAVHEGHIVDQTYNVVDNPCDNNGLDTYWDFKNKKCTNCTGTFKKRLANRLCEVPDGYQEISVYTRCYLGYEEVHKDDALAGCKKCDEDQYSIQNEKQLVCGKCADTQFREQAHCVEFSDDACKVMDVNTSMHMSWTKKQCLCPDGTLPMYGLKSRTYQCRHCGEDTVAVRYNGGGLPSFLCREKGKTVMNTTCVISNPLNEETGLCSCQRGQATVINVLENGTLTNTSYCADILLDTYHINHCNAGGIFVFEYMKTKTMLCMTSGDMSVFDVTDEPVVKPGLNTGAIVGIVIGVLVVLAIIAFVVYWFSCRKQRVQSGAAPLQAPEPQLNQQLI